MCHFLCYRDDQEPFYDRSLVNGKSALSGIHSNALMNQNWEKDLMEAGTAARCKFSIYMRMLHGCAEIQNFSLCVEKIFYKRREISNLQSSM